VLIEVWPCQNKDELRRREQYYIDHATAMFPNVDLQNKLRAIATPEQNRERHVRYNATEKRAITKNRFYKTEKGKASIVWWGQNVKCTCGRTIQRKSICKHERTKFHRTQVLRAAI
jgi:hypothetical protein